MAEKNSAAEVTVEADLNELIRMSSETYMKMRR